MGLTRWPIALRGCHRGYCAFESPLESQDSCSELAEAVDGVVARVDAGGMIWVASPDAVTTIDDRTGWTRPSTSEIVSILSQLVTTADSPTLDALARLAYSLLSPNKVGATLLYTLTDVDNSDHQSPGISVVELNLNVNDPRDWALIEHELRHTDGATIVARTGRLLRKNVILNSTPAAVEHIHTEGGTRHNSSCRHTYDRPDVLAFVVSADGPVTVFSDGARAFSLVLRDRKLPWNPSGGEMWLGESTCPRCASQLIVRKIILYGYREWEEGHCPICKAQVGSVHGWGVEVGLLKNAITIDRIAQFRHRPTDPSL
jgi:DNA integrity scanning protein DisA with diadenylate cyclase activity